MNILVNMRFRVFNKKGEDITDDYEFIITSNGELKQVYIDIVISPPENLKYRIVTDVVVNCK